jgi:hypothetical protein|tara:strand:- start:2574 stop:3485 length:912 start_codon:yes stop_codon:yes gene_type:complete
MSDLVSIDTNNYAAMAKAMGIAGDDASDKKKTNTLPRLRINHAALMGETDMNGKSVKLEVVNGGTYRLDKPDVATYYGASATIRPFMQRFMYKRFVKNMSAKAGEPQGSYHKTVMADSLNIDLKDNQGSFNCGKPAGYVKDFKSLPIETQDLLKQIKRVRVIFGVISLDGVTNEKGESVELQESPFIWEIDNRDAFKTMGEPFNQLAKMKRLPVQHNIMLTTEERKLPNGNSFYLPKASLDVTNTVKLTELDQTMFTDFMAWVQNYNEYIINEWGVKSGQKITQSDMDTVDSFIDIDSAESVG